MSQEREYIVGLKKDVDYVSFNNEMIVETGAGNIPQRSVTVSNPRMVSKRLTHYMLTDSEAEALRQDVRVDCVEIPPDQQEQLEIGVQASQSGNFTKTTLDSGPYINWGLRRVNEKLNVYGGSDNVSGDYNYTLDGSGVDVIIQDTGLQKDHPEWEDANGVSRFKEVDWYTESGISGTQSSNHYRDYHGHGTHVAGTIAGKNYGFAKNADIYALKVAGLEGTGDTGGIPIADCFDVIKEWHKRKVSGTYTPTTVSYIPATGVMVITLGNHNFEIGDKIRIAPGSLTFTCGKDNFASNHSYPRSSGVPNAAGTDPYYNKDIEITSTTSTTITINIGISSNTSEHRFVSALPGAIEATGDKRLLSKRPTVVNMSWGYSTNFVGISGGTYRGASWSGTTARTEYGMVGRAGKHPIRVSSIDIDLEELIEAGVHVTISAGNTKQKIDVVGGTDYDNTYLQYGVTRYYHRGGSPHSQNAHIVGNIDSTTVSNSGVILEQKSTSSETGPGVSIWAPGTNIMSSSSNISTGFTSDTYYFNNGFKQANISGTSMAAPQVAGVISLYLQIQPDATPAEVKDFIQDNAEVNDLYQPGDGAAYNNDRALLLSSPRFLLNQYSSKFGLTLSSLQSGVSSVNASAPTYTITSSASAVDEGTDIVFTLVTTNVTAGTQVPYTVSGISLADLSSGTLTGNFVVGTTDTITLGISADTLTEGNETLTFSLDNGEGNVTVLINDSSSATPTYTLTSNKTSVNEGSGVIITLATTNVSTGSNIPYTITGITANDLSTGLLSGTFVVGTTNTRTISIAADTLTEGAETLTLALDNGGSTIDVTVNDTSTTPAAPTYALTTSSASVNEGQGFTITLSTTGVVSGTSIPYTITGVNSADISGTALTGAFTAGTGLSKAFVVANDATTEGTETFTLTLDNGEASSSVTISDTSLDPAGPTYALARSTTSVNEGGTFTITLTTANVAAATSIPYTITGVTSADIDGASLTGNFVVGSSESLAVTVTEDAATEGAETFAIALDNGEASTTVLINDTSIDTTPTYALSSNADAVNEGTNIIITLATTNVANGTTVAYTISGVTSADINSASLTGNFSINNNTSQLILQTTADATTEGAETLTIALDNGESTKNITINDTSTTPFSADYTISVTNSGNSYNLSGTDRNGAVSGSQPTLAFNNGDRVQFNVNAGTSSSHPFYIKTQSGGGTGYQASGTTGQGTTQLNWTIGSSGTFYYQCSIHGGMNNSITVT